ncbi:MAG: diadenylate cyclase CdaA [Clostridia bacterium]|nr:diadenylate cyclase CdaA [Clostridia bacterium]
MSLTDVLDAISVGFTQFRIQDLIEILILAFVFFKLMQFTSNTRSSQVLKGVGVLLLIFIVSNLLNLMTIKYLLNSFLVSGIVVVVVLFQPEIRRALERIGRFRLNITQRSTPSFEIVNQLCLAIENMSRRKVGALIVLERNTKLGDYVQTGTVIDAEITDALIENIFEPKTPLHDGAMIIRDERIYAAACVLPLFDDPNIARELGTRHRAALGISTVSDSITLVVSEETGTISFSQDGKLTRHVDHDTLEELLNDHFNPSENKGFLMFNTKKNDENTIEEGKEAEDDAAKNGRRKKKNGKRKSDK